MRSNTATLAILSLLCALSLGHMKLNHPVPFGGSTLSLSPLANVKPGTQGSDFPCQQRPGVYHIDEMNDMKVGEPQLLNLTGTASHGGGTCLISVSLDLEPDYKSTWKVIQIFEGGCPTESNGNTGTHPFAFTIPEKFPNGRATLSWTWYNRIGDREIYQNCAPIDITGGADNKDYYDQLPNLYLINLPTSECSSVEMSDLEIPFPGQFVLRDSQKLASASGPSCAASAAAMTKGVSGYKTATLNDGAAYSAPANGGGNQTVSASSAPQTTSAPASNTASSVATSYSAPSEAVSTVTTLSTSRKPTSVASASVSFATMTVSGTAGIFGPTTGTGTAATPAGTGTTCSGDAIHCSADGSQFGLCDHGKIVWQKVASGTKCQDGKIARRATPWNVHARRHVAKAVHEV
ncbi:Hypothetical predicted protein [Lecanosticta acicola]|uniref:Lytic polysaccharide monooxygenase n=1 Tax=Lecanosticta acicola TaxID=111012 RepID=A0AAI8Z8X1_9PEZI|nr:Hypothetical predicted protein [Lecanosticta acicola]